MDHMGNDGFIVARIVEPPLERERSYRIIIEAIAVISGDSIIKTSGKVLCWFEKDHNAGILRTGDRLVIPNNLNELKNSENPFEFDFRSYMRNQRVYADTYVAGDKWFLFGRSYHNYMMIVSGRLRDHLLFIIKNNGIVGKEYAVAGALLLGYHSGLDQDTRQSYASSGAMHILAVSGLHVGILYILLQWFFGFFKRIKYFDFISSIIILCLIWFYALLTGLSPSVTRAATMFSFVTVAKSLNRNTNIFNTLASSALVQLMINPFSLFLVGFQLSYLAVAGIAFFQPLVVKLFRFQNIITRNLWALTTVSFSAQLLIFPLTMYYFNQFPNYFLVTNMFAIPLAMIILYSGLLLFLVSFIPLLSSVVAFVLNFALRSLNFLTEIISYLPFSNTTDIVISIPMLFMLYGIVLFITGFFVMKKPSLLIYALILSITGLSLRADYKIKTHGQHLFIVYNTSGHSLYNFISRKNNILLSGSNDEIDPELIPYVALRPALHLNTGDINFLSVRKFFVSGSDDESIIRFQNHSLVDFAGYRILFARGDGLMNLKNGKTFRVNLVVISSATSLDISDICSSVIPELVIIDSSVDYYRRIKLIEQCLETGIKYHDVRVSGAFFVALK